VTIFKCPFGIDLRILTPYRVRTIKQNIKRMDAYVSVVELFVTALNVMTS
jgi:hypothetical protein